MSRRKKTHLVETHLGVDVLLDPHRTVVIIIHHVQTMPRAFVSASLLLLQPLPLLALLLGLVAVVLVPPFAVILLVRVIMPTGLVF
jgi:hypothetical protein